MTAELNWYRNPIVWLVIAIPAFTVPAGLVTVWLASRGADTVIGEDARLDGRTIDEHRLHGAATRLGVGATLTTDGHTLTVTLREGRAEVPARLDLRLVRTTGAVETRQLQLVRGQERHYTAFAGPLGAGDWSVELSPPERSWRLDGAFRAPLAQLELTAR